MILEAFVLPLPGRSMVVVFWDRVRRGSGETQISVYAPADPSPGELSEVSAALAASLGAATRAQVRYGPRPALLAAWWIGGGLATLAAALHASDAGLPFLWLSALAVGATLPWGMTVRAGAMARRATAARRVIRHLAQLEPVPGTDSRARERVAAVWQFARVQRGAEPEQVRALERFCEEQAWPAASAAYRARLAEPEAPRRGPLRTPATRPRLFAEWEMRAWPST